MQKNLYNIYAIIFLMKYKKLSKDQILISLDRLTRFKSTKEKYTRVFTDILLSSLLEPKLRRADIEKLEPAKLTDYAVEIINASLIELSNGSANKNASQVNSLLCNYENSVFINDSDTQKLLNNDILYDLAVNFIADDMPLNLRWLKAIIENPNINIIKQREKFSLKYPLEKIVIAEGITEEILLPEFSKYLGYDFNQKGLQIIAAGGKNQVVKLYYRLINEVKLPIFILLDKDAEENIAQIKPKLRKTDKIHLVSCGEFEDLLPKSLMVKTVNKHFENFLSISERDLPPDIPTVEVLEELFKTKGLHEFKKAEFAKLVKENISSESDISDEIRNIVSEIQKI